MSWDNLSGTIFQKKKFPFFQFENCSSPSQGSSDIIQTPSPADSSVSDLETVLKEKETQINFLKETMEQNEQVIFKVIIN